MPKLYAQPYNIDARGFYFDSLDEYEDKSENLTDRYGDPVEEFEIQFIDGDDHEQSLFSIMGVTQATLDEYFDVVDTFDEDDMIKVEILMGDLGYSFQDAMDKLDDLIIYGEFRSDEDFAMEYVDSIGSIHDAIGDNAESYFDFDSFGRDLRISGDLYDPDDPDSEERYEDMSDQEIGEEFVDNMGGVGELGNKLQEQYFDWERFARDLMMDMGEHNGVYYDPRSV